MALPAVAFATAFVAPTVIACILATYPISLVIFGWLATKGIPTPRQLDARVIIAALAGIVGVSLAIIGQSDPVHVSHSLHWTQTVVGICATLIACNFIGLNAFSARFGIQNAVHHLGIAEDRAASAIAAAGIGAASQAVAAILATVAPFAENPPTTKQIFLAACNGVTLTAAQSLWLTSTLRSRNLGIQVIIYAEPPGAILLLALTGFASGTNWLTLIAGTIIVIVAGMVATLPVGQWLRMSGMQLRGDWGVK